MNVVKSVINDCGSLGCLGTHTFCLQDDSFNKYLLLTWREVLALSQCLLRERQFICDLCKKWLECKCFLFFEEQLKPINYRRGRNIYVTRVRAKLYNMNYSKWRPHTLDILQTKYLPDKDSLYIKNNYLDF